MHAPRRAAYITLIFTLVGACGSERPPPCAAASCGATLDRDVITLFPDRVDAGSPEDAPSPVDAPEVAVIDVPAMDVPAMDVPAVDVPEVAVDAGADVEMGLDVPQDPPVTEARSDLGTRGLIASLPCGDVLRFLDVQVTPRTVPANSFELRVRNSSPSEVISVWYNATLNTEWNIENLASDLAPGMSVTMSLWRVTGSPAWYVLGISKNQHYYVNDTGIFVELPCGRAARDATQRFRRTITP